MFLLFTMWIDKCQQKYQLMSNLLLKFKHDIKTNSKKFIQKNKSDLRFLTFNVHMWKDINNKTKYKEIMNVIMESDADVIGLQEAMLYSSQIKEQYKKDFKKLGYYFSIVCNDKYGINMLFSREEIISHEIIKLKCDPINNLARYAIFAKINDVVVIVTHLDVYDESENTRLFQIDQIIKKLDNLYPNCPTIIMGDLNSLRFDDYTCEEWLHIVNHDLLRNVVATTKVTNYLESNNFIEGSVLFNTKINMSVWSMRRVDYIYTRNLPHCITNYSTYPTNVSDHYPVYMDIKN